MKTPTGIETLATMLSGEYNPERCKKILQMIDDDICMLKELRKIAVTRAQVNTHQSDIMKLDLPGTEFRVVFIPRGETPEHYPAAQNDEHDIIEFYDRDYPHTPDGQFTGGRYIASSLLNRDKLYGLDLCGQEPKWKVPAQSMVLVIDWLEQCVNIKREVTHG